jgi:hypothetical protein
MKLTTFSVLFTIGLLWVALAVYFAAHATPDSLAARDEFALVSLPLLALALWVGGGWTIKRQGWPARISGIVLLLAAGWLTMLLVGFWLMYIAAKAPPTPPPPPVL